MEIIRKKIIDAISKGLPGIEAQVKLAPEARNLFPPSNQNTTNAAILILLFKDDQGSISTVFMKRQAYNGVHSAQVSFPGGKSEQTDKTLIDTALRESNEEIGIEIDTIEILGKLTELYIPVSNFMVHPFIGITSNRPIFSIDKTEVDYLFTFPIEQLIKHPISETEMEYKGKLYHVPYLDINGEMVWGATAMILSEFIELVKKVF